MTVSASGGHSLGRARQALLDAKANAERNPSGANLQALEEARATMDTLLDDLPHSPHSPRAQTPGAVVSPSLLSHEAYKELYCQPGDNSSGGEQ